MENIAQIITTQRQFFNSGQTKSAQFRITQLYKLRQAIHDRIPEIESALKADLGKNSFDAYVSEIGIVLNEIRSALKLAKALSKPIRATTPLFLWPGHSKIIYEPHGICLIISPWNYPFQLTMAPLVAAIAAGNCAVVKPSERSPHTSRVMQQLLEDTFSSQYVFPLLADKTESAKLLHLPFDKFFFTGSKAVGQIIYQHAAKKMIPVTLELGGKNPCIVSDDANLSIAAQRIAWGKFFNTGQTCVAPDYLLIHEKVKENFLAEMKIAIHTLYGDNPKTSPFYGRIIDAAHLQQLEKLLDNQQVIVGGDTDITQNYMAPTIVDNVEWTSSIMKDEIFGPILPIITYTNLPNTLERIQQYPQPLALYLFATNRTVQKQVFHSISFGGGCINDTLVHFSSPHLPVGGVGASGIGRYRGKRGFEAFSNQKTLVKMPLFPNIQLRYPPFPKWKHILLKRLMK